MMKNLLAIVTAVSVLATLGATPPPKPYVPAPPRDAVSHHVAHVGGQTIPYTARAGTITLRNAKDQITAHMFYVAYTKDGSDLSRRPVTFFYNGGPGSSTIWLHMGSFAPVRVVTANGVPTASAPYGLNENRYSLLDKSDLVFIDAPNTGYSRVIGYGDPKDFMGVDQDGAAFTQFIQRYITQFNRWNSPKFLFGESYGTTRDAVLVNMLQDAGVQFNGVVLLSAILNFGLASLGGSNPIAGGDWTYVLYLPSEAASAWYHHKVPNRPASLTAFLRGVEQFAGNEYLHGLAQGDRMSSSTREDIVAKLHAYLGLSETYIRDSDLRISYPRFEKELLRTNDAMVGRLDSRFQSYGLDAAADSPEWDPADVAVTGAYVGAFGRYVHDQLHFTTNLVYRPTAYTQLGARWDMHHNGQDPPANVAPDLAQAMSENPHLKVMLAGGYYDFATPYFAAAYTLNHLGVAPAVARNITFRFYQSGHMVYLNPASLAQFKADLSRWYDSATR
jgi:carboxypeptidase C (cathepsin A)